MSEYKEVAKLIAEAVAAETIYLLGCTLSHVRTESIFADAAATSGFVSHCYVLVLVNKSCANSCNNLQDKIENVCRCYIPVTAIVLDMQQYNDWLTEGHRFARRVSETAECLHGAGDVKHLLPATAGEAPNPVKLNEAYFDAGINKVAEFLAGADLYRIREQNKMAAFMLHQAAEQALHTLFRISTGLYVNTHNIDKLIRYCSMVSNNVAAIFPRNNEKNEHIFQLLQKAYIDSRYKEHYSIGTDHLLIITERIRAIEGILKETYTKLTTHDIK